jgi:hypothetical protein
MIVSRETFRFLLFHVKQKEKEGHNGKDRSRCEPERRRWQDHIRRKPDRLPA